MAASSSRRLHGEGAVSHGDSYASGFEGGEVAEDLDVR
jgi:hypothetical protein